MPRTYKLEGIIVKRKNTGESDKIITILTKHQGKKNLIAKGIRKIHSRKASHLEIFNQVIGFAASGKKWDYLVEAQVLNSFPGIKKDLSLIAFSYRMMELVDILCPEELPAGGIYNLLMETLLKLDGKIIPAENLMNSFVREMLVKGGYLPDDQLMSISELNTFLGRILERKLKSDILLTHLKRSV